MAKSEHPCVAAAAGIGGRRLLLLLPALLAFTLTAAVFSAAVLRLGHPGPADFQRRATAALSAGKPKEALIWLRRQIGTDPAALPPRLRLIETYAALNQTQPMDDLLNQIAPGDRVVYGPAHLYRAQRMMAGGAADPQTRAAALNSLELARQADPAKGQGTVDLALVAALKVELQMAGGDWNGALATAATIPAATPATRLLAAIALKNLGRQAEADLAADQAVVAIREMAPGTSLEERLRRAALLAQASMVKGEWQGALDRVLAAGDEPQFKVLQASVALQAAKSYRAGRDSGRWLESMLRGLAAQPADLELTTELMTGVGQRTLPPGFSETCANRLTEAGLAAHGQLLAALSSAGQNQTDEAFSQFKNAWQLLPGNPVIANHYAALLGVRPNDGDPEAALAIIDGVLKTHPGIPAFQDTRGRVLLRLGRLDERGVDSRAGAPR